MLALSSWSAVGAFAFAILALFPDKGVCQSGDGPPVEAIVVPCLFGFIFILLFCRQFCRMRQFRHHIIANQARRAQAAARWQQMAVASKDEHPAVAAALAKRVCMLLLQAPTATATTTATAMQLSASAPLAYSLPPEALPPPSYAAAVAPSSTAPASIAPSAPALAVSVGVADSATVTTDPLAVSVSTSTTPATTTTTTLPTIAALDGATLLATPTTTSTTAATTAPPTTSAIADPGLEAALTTAIRESGASELICYAGAAVNQQLKDVYSTELVNKLHQALFTIVQTQPLATVQQEAKQQCLLWVYTTSQARAAARRPVVVGVRGGGLGAQSNIGLRVAAMQARGAARAVVVVPSPTGIEMQPSAVQLQQYDWQSAFAPDIGSGFGDHHHHTHSHDHGHHTHHHDGGGGWGGGGSDFGSTSIHTGTTDWGSSGGGFSSAPDLGSSSGWDSGSHHTTTHDYGSSSSGWDSGASHHVHHGD